MPQDKFLALKVIYNQLCDCLTFEQYAQICGGTMDFKAKARRAMAVSKSAKVQELGNAILAFEY